jgi:hypothetical protein
VKTVCRTNTIGPKSRAFGGGSGKNRLRGFVGFNVARPPRFNQSLFCRGERGRACAPLLIASAFAKLLAAGSRVRIFCKQSDV